jgi:hypothetical protein
VRGALESNCANFSAVADANFELLSRNSSSFIIPFERWRTRLKQIATAGSFGAASLIFVASRVRGCECVCVRPLWNNQPSLIRRVFPYCGPYLITMCTSLLRPTTRFAFLRAYLMRANISLQN